MTIMEMYEYLFKKVDLVCKDGEKYSGYILEVEKGDDTSSGCDEITIDANYPLAIQIDDIAGGVVDERFKPIDFFDEGIE